MKCFELPRFKPLLLLPVNLLINDIVSWLSLEDIANLDRACTEYLLRCYFRGLSTWSERNELNEDDYLSVNRLFVKVCVQYSCNIDSVDVAQWMVSRGITTKIIVF